MFAQPQRIEGSQRPVQFFKLTARAGSITLCIYGMRYEWDEAKNRRNQRRHGGISFELAALVFEDRRCLVGRNRIDETGEQRWHAIGAVHILWRRNRPHRLSPPG